MYSRLRPLPTRCLLVAMTALLLVATMPGAVRAQAVAAVATARQQLDWLLGATSRVPVPTAELEAHVTAAGLTALGGPARLNDVLDSFAGSRIEYRVLTTPTVAQAVTRAADGQQYVTTVQVDASGLISTLFFEARPAAPTSWTAVDRGLRSLAPDVSFTTARVTAGGSCRRVHGLNPTSPQPLGSAFKLYVLGALARAVSQGTASWDEKLAIRDDWKSLPSGELQNEPAGTKLTLAQYADKMISISDNTAADHLIHRLGRAAVQRELVRLGNAHPSLSTPFPTTRELFTLKGYRYPTLAKAYVGAPRALQAALLRATAAVPRQAITAWTQPRDTGSIEWFGSADDMCRALAGLQKSGSAPVAHALSINSGGLALDPSRYPTVFFKGGSEPGVVTLNYLVQDADGSSVVTSVLLHDPHRAFDEDTVVARAQTIIRGALALAAGS